jgi:uncharacterized protein (TIGR02391 family)
MPLAQVVHRDDAVAMELHELGAIIVDDLPRTDPQHRRKESYIIQALATWHPRPGVRDAHQLRLEDPDAAEALEEALHWLEREGFVRIDSVTERLELTRRGRHSPPPKPSSGPPPPPGARELALSLHPKLGEPVRQAVARGQFQTAVTAAGVALEDVVRTLSGSALHGERLFASEFGKSGSLRDPRLDPNEADGLVSLFAGFIKAIRNPAAHRSVDYSDQMTGLADVLLADRLIRAVDAAARRLGRQL